MRRAIVVIGMAACAVTAVLPVSARAAAAPVPSGAAVDPPGDWPCYRQGQIVYFGGLPWRARRDICGPGFDPASVPALWEPAW
ncbi:hypothetical protein Skr01_59490 [Sphaerisporangium krabiense]|uniref:Chitin-binding type-3 domain-containing protein n=1 Tax=Sphaerisporangium krabiense TaxID=763782 RepID=A0A7W9DTM3_9ACTN|nr:hypothetical protein [Sphaerisporangium krabiense]MBB5630982.1 hypothetical protein [Sphaerisporangium krabiense]GII65864.1 hypothetical protein Skr01_59490 [Sphaerisporangium krabiense]